MDRGEEQKGNELLLTKLMKLSHNLLSVGQLLRKNFAVRFDDNACTIVDKSRNVVIANIEMSNKTFPLMLPVDDNLALQAECDDVSHLWHLRYGHLHSKRSCVA
ncbi:hypothetical protein C2S52_008184 [Perilla frutescens var. hirtella]|nr:hypothetical protein C2S52_008184 [Perilla frutescens var. hirtella]